MGLTCATFVVAFFHSLGWPIVELESWPNGREGDAEWQDAILNALLSSGASSQHIDTACEHIGVARYRPEEVAVAATCDDPPLNFSDADELARDLLAIIQTA